MFLSILLYAYSLSTKRRTYDKSSETISQSFAGTGFSLVPFFALSTSASAVDPYAEHGLCITEIALGEVGTTEQPINITKYGEWYETQASWCAIFVSWCAYKAQVSEEIIVKSSSPDAHQKHFIDNGQYYQAPYYGGDVEPQVGDIYFCSNEEKYPQLTHVGIIVEVDETYIHTVDGNWGDMVKVRNPPLEKTSMYFLGFGRPAYTTDHYFSTQNDETTHWYGCSVCNYTTPTESHFCYIQSDNSNHWEECGDCGYKRNIATHTWMVGNKNHLCEDCGLNAAHIYTWTKTTTKHMGSCFCGRLLSEEHVFPTSASPCSVCGYAVGDIGVVTRIPKKQEIS